jgi:hypothetical protein
VKDGRLNLNTIIIILNSIVSCETLNVVESFQNKYFGHAYSKVDQYANYWRKNVQNLEKCFHQIYPSSRNVQHLKSQETEHLVLDESFSNEAC